MIDSTNIFWCFKNFESKLLSLQAEWYAIQSPSSSIFGLWGSNLPSQLPTTAVTGSKGKLQCPIKCTFTMMMSWYGNTFYITGLLWWWIHQSQCRDELWCFSDDRLIRLSVVGVLRWLSLLAAQWNESLVTHIHEWHSLLISSFVPLLQRIFLSPVKQFVHDFHS